MGSASLLVPASTCPSQPGSESPLIVPALTLPTLAGPTQHLLSCCKEQAVSRAGAAPFSCAYRAKDCLHPSHIAQVFIDELLPQSFAEYFSSWLDLKACPKPQCVWIRSCLLALLLSGPSIKGDKQSPPPTGCW